MALPRPLLLLLSLGLTLVGCGGGGGGGGGAGGAISTSGGGSENTGPTFQSVGGPDGSLIAGVNASVSLVFSKNVAPASVKPDSLGLVTVTDVTGQTSTPAGVLASYTTTVDKQRIIITPTVEFAPDKVTYGFAANALYEISFNETAGPITSTTGQPLVNSSQTYFFRTPNKALDLKAGFPGVVAYLVDDAGSTLLPESISDANLNGSLVDEVLTLFGATEADNIAPAGGGSKTVPATNPQDLIFVFDDALIPSSVLNTSDSSSPAIRVLINIPGQFAFQPIVAPAELSFVHQQLDLTIVGWSTKFLAYPPGGLLVAEVSAEVQDLGGNSKVSITGSNTPLISKSVLVAGGADPTLYAIGDEFIDKAFEDAPNTSAVWSSAPGDVLRPELGGGRGLDGPLVIDPLGTPTAPGKTVVPLRAVVDFTKKSVRLPVVADQGGGIFEPRVWELERLTLPANWTLAPLTDRNGDGTLDPEEFLVQVPGHPFNNHAAPLVILSTGIMDVAGTIEVSALAGETLALPTSVADPLFAPYLAQGGKGGEQLAAGGDGGAGGSVLALRSNGSVAAPLVSSLVIAPGQQFNPSDGRLRGATGRSASLQASGLAGLAVDTLVDGSQALVGFWDPGNPGTLDSAIQSLIDQRLLLLQPNLGMGSTQPLGAAPNSGTANQSIDENHRSFRVSALSINDVAGTTSVRVDLSAGGSLSESSLNVGSYPNPAYAPIAAAGDSYLLGPLAGRKGGDDSLLGRGGFGAEPYTVVNSLAIQTTGGGGGGGGGVAAGSAGQNSGPQSNPSLNQRSGSGGISLSVSAGAPGGQGAIRGTGKVIDGTTFDLLTHSAGLDPLTLDGSVLVGKELVANAPNDGWRFRIAAVTGGVGQAKSLTLEPVDAGPASISLTSSPAGVNGPGLAPTAVVPYLILPLRGFGGSGGGGSGVSVTGTLNNSAAALARLAPGAGGGSGGGGLRLETARQFVLRSTGRIFAKGGAGGTVPSSQAGYSGGGGGAGGSIEVAAGTGMSLSQGSQVSVIGGLGAGIVGQGRGGDGGSGWLRFENFADTLAPSTFAGLTTPIVGQENLGRLTGDPRSVAQSLFYFTGLANPLPLEVSASYQADTNGDDVVETGLEWTFDAQGRHGGPGNFERPPFRFLFNPTTVDTSGFLDLDAASPTFYEASDLVAGRTGLVFDPVAASLLYAPGRTATLVHCLSGCATLALPALPGGDGFAVDLTGLAVGPGQELFLLQQAVGKVAVIDQVTGVLKRTISLPQVIEGGLAYVPGAVAADDRLVIASNRADRLVTFRPKSPTGGSPSTTNYSPLAPEDVVTVIRDGRVMDIEFTGLAYDAATLSLWAVDAMDSSIMQVNWAAGSQGLSSSAAGHPYVPIMRAGENVIPSSVAFDGVNLHITVASDPDGTSAFSFTPGDLAAMAGEYQGPALVLPAVPAIPLLPQLARPIASGLSFLRFRIVLDGLFDDDLHNSGFPVSFRDIAVDEVSVQLRNVGF